MLISQDRAKNQQGGQTWAQVTATTQTRAVDHKTQVARQEQLQKIRMQREQTEIALSLKTARKGTTADIMNATPAITTKQVEELNAYVNGTHKADLKMLGIRKLPNQIIRLHVTN